MVDLLAAFVKGETRSDLGLSDIAGYFGFNGATYQYGLNQTLYGDREEIPGTFDGYVSGAYKSNGIVFACELIRMMVFSEARLMYRKLISGRPGELHHTSSLNVLHRPGPGLTTGDMLTRAILDADLAGNHFAVRSGSRVVRLRPDWVSIMLGSDRTDMDAVDDPEAEVIAYFYHPKGNKYADPIIYLPEDVAHWAPIPDPIANFRGMSWLTPVVREIQGDKLASAHKNKFFENGGTPNMIVKNEISDVDTFQKWVALFRDRYEGLGNAYRTWYLGAGADATVVGKDMQQLDFKVVQGAGETRIAAASGVGAVMAQFSEGMQGSSLNAGNYAAARRRVADALFRPLWRSFCGSYEQIVTVPRNSELWYDERDIAFLREDEKDAAEIQQIRATSIRALLDAGYEADSVVAAIENDDFSLLTHSGLFSVQLQPPGTTTPEPEPDPDPDPDPEVDDD